MIRHIVFFRAKNPADKETIFQGLSLLAGIPHSRHFEIGRNLLRASYLPEDGATPAGFAGVFGQIAARYGITGRLQGVPSVLVVEPHSNKLINQGHTAALADARSMSPQALADWLASWVG